MSYDASDRKDVRRAQRDAKIAERARGETLAWIMSTTSGRRWMHDLLAEMGIGATPYVATNMYQTAFNCGQQNLGLRLWGELQTVCPDLYLLMMRESNERRSADDNRRGGDNQNGNGGPRESDLYDETGDFDGRVARGNQGRYEDGDEDGPEA